MRDGNGCCGGCCSLVALLMLLAIIALLGVRKSQLAWWQKLFTIIGLASVGALVLVVKILAH